MKKLLSICNLHSSIDNKAVLNGISLDIEKGKIYAIMGPNGSGKSSLALTLMGHPRYTIASGSLTFLDQDITTLSPDQRAKQGIFLALQHPYEIEGIPFKHFLRQAYNALYDGTEKQLRIKDFHTMLLQKLKLLKMDESFIDRSVNVGFSGGEKKRAEILQLAILQPKIAILDEIDSGLDIDALKIVCQSLQAVKQDNPDMAIVLITHYQRILKYLTPDIVHVLQYGKIVKTGDSTLAEELETQGYTE